MAGVKPNDETLLRFKTILQGRHLERTSKQFDATLNVLKSYQGNEQQARELRKIVCDTFAVNEDELVKILLDLPQLEQPKNGAGGIFGPGPEKVEREFRALLPLEGFFADYISYTDHSEPPLPYHFFCALTGIGATINRNIYFDMGYYKLYATLGIILLGPSGIKKTSAGNIIVNIIRELGITKVYSEKLTPEALVEAMKGEDSVGLVYAPEMAVFVNKQRYMEGIIPLLTRFMDCPDLWESGTIMRGNSVLKNIAISVLMCSTPDWFIENTPADMFGGGFIARNLLIVQERSCRIEPIPRPGNPSLRDQLILHLAYLSQIKGEMRHSKAAMRWYKDWYRQSKERDAEPEHELMQTYYQRKFDHTHRIAICLHIVQHDSLELCLDCFQRAKQILEYMEQFLPALLVRMFKTRIGEEQESVIKAIRSEGGFILHSKLLHKLQHKFSAQQIRTYLHSLQEQGMVGEKSDNVCHAWYLIGEDVNG